MAIDLDRTIDAANAILLCLEDTFNANGIALPARKYITVGGAGTVAYDCEQLTISWEQTYSGRPGNPLQEITKCTGIRSGTFIVELVRPITISQKPDIPPEAHLIQADAERLMQDATLLYYAGLLAAETHNPILEGGGLATVVMGAPAGGYQSIVMNVIMPI